MKKTIKPVLRSNQQGVVSIVVAVFMMLVLALIVLGMSQDTRREQRQTLDRQLSDQAFYNAETGINDAASYLYTTPTAPLDNMANCGASLGGASRDINAPGVPNGSNRYTCLLYDKAPKTIQYDNVSTSSPKIVPIQTVNNGGSPVALSSLTVSWDDSADRNAAINGGCNFSSGSPELPNDCGHGGLRFELVPPSENRELMRQRSLIAFLLPNNGAGTNISLIGLNYPDNQGLISAADCSGGPTVRRCSKTVTDINRDNLYLNLRSLYRPVNVTIAGKDSSGTDVRFKDTQVMIDSTGRANDVLRRVQVRIPANSQYYYPGFTLHTKDSVCKVLDVQINSVTSADNSSCPIN